MASATYFGGRLGVHATTLPALHYISRFLHGEKRRYKCGFSLSAFNREGIAT